MILTVSLNPALDKSLTVEGIIVDGVNRVISSRLDAGGKSINVSKMVKVLGGETLATGIVGGSNGQFILNQLSQMGIAHDFVHSSNSTRTNLKITDMLHHTTTEFNELGEPVAKELLDQVWMKISSTVKAGDYVVISGTNPPGMPDDTIAGWIKELKAMDVYTALDTVGEPMRLGIEAQPNIIKPNLTELSEMFGEQLHYIRDIIAAARQVTQKGVERVIVSMGADGALFVTRDQILRGYGVQVPIGSTVGSGDAMLAALVHFQQQGADWSTSAAWSLATGAANATCHGVQVPSMEQIQKLYNDAVVEPLM